MNARELAAKALEVLDERGWHQGGYEGPDGSVCIAGALHIAATGESCRGNHAADRALYEIARDTVYAEHGAYGATEWNDDEFTTLEDVRLALKRLAS